MMNSIATVSASERAQSEASGRLHQVADMTLHQLVDEFVALTAVIKAGSTESPGTYATSYNDEALIAMQNRNLVNGATRARFGIEFSLYDSLF